MPASTAATTTIFLPVLRDKNGLILRTGSGGGDKGNAQGNKRWMREGGGCVAFDVGTGGRAASAFC